MLQKWGSEYYTPPKVEDQHVNENGDSESNSLLPPKMGFQESRRRCNERWPSGFGGKKDAYCVHGN